MAGKEGDLVRAIELCLWTMVILVQMVIVCTLDSQAETAAAPQKEQSRQVVVWSALYEEKEACEVPMAIWTDEDAVDYALRDWEIVPARERAKIRRVWESVAAEAVEGADELPTQLECTVRDEERAQEVVALCRLQSQRVTAERWEEGFVLPVTFHEYGAESYRLGETVVDIGGESPDFAEKEELLRQAGLSGEDYRITEICWAGEPYVGADGVWCRDAQALGQKLVRDYLSEYSGIAEFPERTGWKVRAVYGTGQTALADSETPAESEEVETTEELPERMASFWQKVTDFLLITVGIGVMLFFGGFLALAVVRVAKKVRAWYNNR